MRKMAKKTKPIWTVNVLIDMKPTLGFPRMIIFSGKWASLISLEDGCPPLVELHTLNCWVNALYVTENCHCFRIERMYKGPILTPWYLRGWKEPACIAFRSKTRYCPSLSFDNVYPLLWNAIDVAEHCNVSFVTNGSLKPFATEKRVSCYGDGGKMSRNMKRRLKQLLDERVPLREFFEAYVKMLKGLSFNSAYL